MFQGFYNATSGVLTQNRNLNVISNNMANVSTPGFKSDKFLASTFREVLFSRIGNKDKEHISPLGQKSMIRASDTTKTDFTNEMFAPTRNPLDFAISGSGFFAVQSGNGVVYTRNGSFTLDDQGFLYLPTIGRVLGQNGAPIYLGTDKITVNSAGTIYNADESVRFGTLQIVDFQDYDAQLVKTTGNVFIAPGGGGFAAGNARVTNKALESSNVDAVKEMVEMMSSQRALQSSAQVMKMYDQLVGKMVSQLGPV